MLGEERSRSAPSDFLPARSAAPCNLRRRVKSDDEKRRARKAWMRWAIATAIPAAGILELSAHLVQTCSPIPERDWRAARDYTASSVRPEDLIAFAPRWVDPVGRD
jgi:hypothetical protein